MDIQILPHTSLLSILTKAQLIDIVNFSQTSKKNKDIVAKILRNWEVNSENGDLISNSCQIPNDSPFSKYAVQSMYQYIKSTKEFDICHIESPHYLKRIKDNHSIFGEVVQLISVCWLEYNISFTNLPVDTYSVYYKVRFDKHHSIPELHSVIKSIEPINDSEKQKIYKNEIRNKYQIFKKGQWYLLYAGEINQSEIIGDKMNIYLTLHSYANPWWKSGLFVDYVHLIPKSKGIPLMLYDKETYMKDEDLSMRDAQQSLDSDNTEDEEDNSEEQDIYSYY